jgi:hypothetical protein
MKIAQIIAQKLFEAGISLQNDWEVGALLDTPEHLRPEITRIWLGSVGHEVEIVMNGRSVQALGAQGAWIEAVFSDMQGGDLLGEIDSALWQIQQLNIKESAA